LGEKKLGYQGSSRACTCQADQKFVTHRPRTVVTLLGPVAVRRAYYHCPRCGDSAAPYDARVGLGPESLSVGLAKAVTMLAVAHPYREAAAILKALAGQSLGAETIRRLTLRLGQTAGVQEDQAAGQMAMWQPPAATSKPERLYTSVDGVMVRLQAGFKEAKTVVCYGEDARGRPTRRVAVRFDSAGEFKAHAWATACRHGLEHAEEQVLLGDGAAWIWDHVGGVLGDDVTHIVDWYHATQHVWACGQALHGEGAAATRVWVESITSLLHEGRVRRIIRRLEDERRPSRAPAKRQALSGLITYLTNQDRRLAYDRFRARGLDIGSGQVEAACKHVVAARMKRSGMRWSPAGAQAVLSLRCTWLNEDWDDFWEGKPLAA